MIIGTKFKIESEPMNIILSQKIKRQSRAGEKYVAWKVIGYFATVENALHELVNLKVRESHLKDVRTIMAEIEKLHKMIEGVSGASTRRKEATKGGK
jgi:hypothetical protein